MMMMMGTAATTTSTDEMGHLSVFFLSPFSSPLPLSLFTSMEHLQHRSHVEVHSELFSSRSSLGGILGQHGSGRDMVFYVWIGVGTGVNDTQMLSPYGTLEKKIPAVTLD